MLTAIFSDYPGMDERRSSGYPSFMKPSSSIDGVLPRTLTLVGDVECDMSEEDRYKIGYWFWHDCVDRLSSKGRHVIIEADLPECFAQWYIAAEYYKG